MHPKLRYYGGAIVRYRMRRQAERFVALTAVPRETQQRVLRELLDLNAGSEFALRHRLAEIRSPADFRRNVPVADFEYYRPYVERLKQGELGALLGRRNQLLMFALTSGTTAETKFVPITRRFLDDYRRGWTVWAIRTYDDHPAMHRQNMLQVTSDHDQFRTPGGHPCGNISGLVTAMQTPLVRTMYTVPAAVSKIPTPEAKYYTALRLSLADRNVGMVTTANPSTLIHLVKLADVNRDEIIRDIAQGTLCERFDVPPDVRQAIRSRCRRNPERARELEQIVSRTGKLSPREAWPRLALLAVWTGGSAGAYLPALRSHFGDVPLRDHGLSASEGRMTIPLVDNRPEGVLDIAAHYFEFIPEDEYGRPGATILEAHELEPGRNYYILLTTSSGLCRYDIRDVVRCTGHFNRTPLLEFLNKGAHVSNITGEKISESQVVAAVREAVVTGKVDLSHYTLAPVWGDPPGYRLLVEECELASPDAGRSLADAVDARLQALNVEYGDKRRTGRLAPLEHVAIPTGSWIRFQRQRLSKVGSSAEQYKHPCLVPDLEFLDKFVGEFGPPASRPAVV